MEHLQLATQSPSLLLAAKKNFQTKTLEYEKIKLP